MVFFLFDWGLLYWSLAHHNIITKPQHLWRISQPKDQKQRVAHSNHRPSAYQFKSSKNDQQIKSLVPFFRIQFRIQKRRKTQKSGSQSWLRRHKRQTRFSIQPLYKRYNMGTLFSKKKKLDKIDQIRSELSSVFDHSIEPPHKLVIRQAQPVIAKEKVELSFKQISSAKKQAIIKSPMVSELLYSEKWIIEPEIIEHLRIINAFEFVEQSPALALHINLIKSSSNLICNPKGLQNARNVHKNKDSSEQKSLYNQYAVIYADLFSIKFMNLVKVKIKGLPKQASEAIVSLQPLAKLHAPFLEQLTADGHPITNARFLRRCNWPNLFKLSLRDNAIIDSRQLGAVIAGLTSSCHLQSLDLSGLYSSSWTQISWVLKLGFCDAALQSEMLQKDDNYYRRYNGKVLQRVDCAIGTNRLFRPHLRMLKQKFNTRFFDNPIAIW